MEFDPFSEDYFNGAWETYRWLRDEAPVYYNARQNFWALSRYDDVKNALGDSKTYISSRGVLLDLLHDPDFNASESMPGFLIMEDQPKHTRLRRLTSASFTPKGVAKIEAAVRDAIMKFLTPLSDATRFDFVEDLVGLIPGQVIFDMFGVPECDHAQLRGWYKDFLKTDDVQDDTFTNTRRIQATVSLYQYFEAMAAERRLHPRDDLVSKVVHEVYVEDGVEQRLTDAEVGWYAMMVNSAGQGTVTLLSADTIVQFSRHPDQWQKILRDPSLIGAAVEEIVRFDSPVHYVGRRSTKDVSLHGVNIPAGANILMLIGCANRDERAFENPDIFDVERKSDISSIGFGYGPHTCVGLHLGRLQTRIVIDEVAKRWPNFGIDESGLRRSKEVASNGFSSVPFMTERTMN